ncbi:hypothetical protein L3X38_027025 [Prunus dulcis]|uniref:Integrase catalytic domain-containing protein n=1 Tax=Prunus dulcis TaxID=3755 RepID=A0AAD4VM56_PRUDU|nr:hypothetical protein L3X38_027025 [Prunus dulcis]
MASFLKIDGLLGMLTIRLNDDNFLKWSYQLESVLQGYDLFGHFDGSYVSPPKFAIVDEEGASSELTTAYKDWIRRQGTLEPSYCFSLRAAAVQIFDDDFVIAALNGLPPEFAIIKTVLIARDSPITLKDFRAQLLAAEKTAELRIVHHSGLYAANSSAGTQPSSVASGQGLLPTPLHSQPPPSRGFSSRRGRFTGGRNHQSQYRSSGFRGASPSNFGGSGSYKVVPECQICSKRGHTAANCYFRHAPSSDASSPVVECQICGKRGHAALDCYHRSNYAFQGQAPPSSLTAMTAQSSYSPEQVWIADTGASHHMVGDASQLHNLTSCDVPENVTVGNGEGLAILNLGTTSISCANTRSLSLPSVFYVPKLKANLLSDKLTKQIVLQGKSNHGLYHIPLAPSSAPVAYLGQQIKSSLWHKRLGHPTNEVVKLMLQASAVSVSPDSVSALCSACLFGKMHRLPFPSEHVRSKIAFQRIYSDVWGPSRNKSIDGYRYYVSFVDECTGFLWLYPLLNKSGVFEIFLKFYAFICTQFGAHLQYFQSDGGGEFNSLQFASFLDSKGIIHRLSCPSTPQQNGFAERKNRHVIETALTLLVPASLPGQFWYHAVAHAAYLINFMPSIALGNQSPFQKLFGKPPLIQHLRVFGTAVYPYVRPFNEHKLQSRTVHCVFMGYSQGYKGVICYNTSTHRFLLSRHVVHDENVFPFGNSQSALPSSNISSCPSSSFKPPPIVVSVSHHVPSLASSPVPNIASSHFSAFPSSVSAFFGGDPVLIGSSAASIENLQVLNDQQLQALLPSQESSSSFLAPPMHPMQTRSKSGIVKPKPFEEYQCYLTTIPSLHDTAEPATYKVASQSSVWIQAMRDEIAALHTQGTWDLVSMPVDKNIVGSRWVYRVKKNSDGSVARYKARLVAQGFSQAPCLDFSETFSPVVRHTTVRLVLSIAAMNRWSLRQLDVKNAFLHGDLEEEVFMRQPQGFEDSKYPSHVCRLRKSLYGLKQAPRAWNAKFTGHLPAIGFTVSHSDPSLFVKHVGSDSVLLLLYVDDIILIGSKDGLVQEVIDELSAVFEMKDMGRLTYFLGLQISYHDNGDIFVCQTKYARDLLAKAGMDTCRSCTTPCKPHCQLLASEGDSLSDPTIYRSIVGALQYLTFTRLDLCYAVNTVCQYMTQPSYLHFQLVKRILRYIHGTLDHGLNFTSGSWDLHAYSDADWASDVNTRRSTTGFVVYLGNNPISWQSKKQSSVSRSSTEAEYRALANTAADLAWIRQVLLDLRIFLPQPPTIHCDNLSALALSSNSVYHSRIKHLDIDFHFVRERVQKKDLFVQYIPTEEQVADIFTKGLHGPIFLRHCRTLQLSSSAGFEGE